MKRLYSLPTLLTCLLLVGISSDIAAQALRAEGTFFVKPRVGFSNYLGDWDITPFDFDDWDNSVPWAAGLELGYQVTTRYSISGAYQVGSYPTIELGVERLNDYDQRHSAQLLFRYTVQGGTRRVAPFIEAGLHGTVGYTEERVGDPNEGDDLFAFGPMGGLGLDIVLAPKLSLHIEALSMLAVPDNAVDGADEPEDAIDGTINDEGPFSRFDVLSFVGLGLKYSFKAPAVAPMISGLECPTRLTVGQSGSFAAMVNDDATEPVEYRWMFGDNNSAQGMRTSHAFNTAGNYTVSFTATNAAGMAERSCTVEVVPVPVSAAIVTFGADRSEFEICEPQTVTFTADVRGDAPVRYAWDLDGDGTTDATGRTATFRYDRAGTYTATLTITNAAGSDTRSVTIRALDCTSICDDITELNSVYFGRNSSTLTAEGRAALAENVALLSECPNLCVRVEGFAAPGERNPQALSTDRGEAVADFYRDNGMAGSRILAMGMGRVGGTTSKKEGTAQFQRADSIPVPCEDLND